jgi:hypothetical protein
MMHGREKSDSAIVAGKPTNKAVPTAAEPVERRAGAKGNASQQSTLRTQCRITRVTGAGAHTASSPSHTQGGSRVPELGPLGSVRGALSNERPYRDPCSSISFRSQYETTSYGIRGARPGDMTELAIAIDYIKNFIIDFHSQIFYLSGQPGS